MAAVVLSATLSSAQTWTELERRIDEASPTRSANALRRSPKVGGSADLIALDDKSLVEAVRVRARIEKASDDQAASGSAAKIKESLGIVDGRTSGEANWLRDALNRLQKIGTRQEDPYKPPNVDPSAVLVIGVYLMWGVLAVAVVVFVVFAFLHLSNLKRRTVVKALVEEDEPERTVDEWLAQAQELEAQGRHREAVRALYLACLLRLDEAGVARFIRHETNWEHQHRIDASPKRPPSLDMRPATQLMDRVWYGFRTEGAPDVARIRSVYELVLREAFAK